MKDDIKSMLIKIVGKDDEKLIDELYKYVRNEISQAWDDGYEQATNIWIAATNITMKKI